MVDIPISPGNQLAADDSHFRWMLEQVPGVFWTTDADLRFTSSLGQGLAHLGLKNHQAVGMSLHVFFQGTPQGAVSIAAHLKALEGFSTFVELDVMGRVFQSHTAPLRHNEEIIGVIGMAIDITDRKTEEKRLRESNDRLEISEQRAADELSLANTALGRSERRLAGILNAPSTFIARADLAQKLTYINDAFARGYSAKLGDNSMTFIHADDRGRVEKWLASNTNPSAILEDEHRCWINGEWRWVFWQYSLIHDLSGKLQEIQGVGFDVHERHLAEDALRRSEMHFKELADFNRRLVMELDHRVRNNLAGLIGLVSLMRLSSPSVELFADAIHSRLCGIAEVHRLLTLRRWNHVSIRVIFESLTKVIHASANCKSATVALQGPDLQIESDLTLPLAMIFLEWLTNSCKYGAHSTPEGRVTIDWTLEQRDELPWLSLHWREHDGPAVPKTLKRSLGTRLVESFATRELKGHVTLGFPESGADHRLEFPARNWVSGPDNADDDPRDSVA